MDKNEGRLYGAASHDPPAYLDCDQSAPAYQNPRFNHMTTDSTTLVAATTRFPPAFNCYGQWKWKQLYSLGPSSDEKLFTVSFDNKLFSKKQLLFLHSGPSDKGPVIASLSSKTLSSHYRATITLRGEDDKEQGIAFERPENVSWTQGEVRAFRIEVRKGVVEEFQWRSSHGDEIKELAGHSYGWKLVRMETPPAGQKSFGYSSDGKEVVAVLAHSTSWSMTKSYNFGFLGTGLTGTLGEDWETAAVISGFSLWHVAAINGSATSASSAAAAATVAS
ncbi:hypothetical protein LY78DRAFT_655860 [Colletotrichum sublineola]|uniref:Uncharacterized protein n=1 Tax=Colletotrichum sublineola TaxID=1173701 RepID=A0A066XMI9_COLSU|nr:hypothetical protein LY78DRAFT_655860 [Colletotrichum sublineola]KDN70428.1 hypothetical protein CSUB01_09218 [Colletotrichum sublineola]